MAVNRIAGAALILTIDEEDFAAEIIEATIEHEDPDTDGLTFGDVMNIGDKGKIKIKAVQSTDTASFWRTVWENARRKDVPFVYAVHGNAVPTTDQPHIVGTLDIGNRPTIGGAADPTKNYEFEVEWDCTADKTLRTAPVGG